MESRRSLSPRVRHNATAAKTVATRLPAAQINDRKFERLVVPICAHWPGQGGFTRSRMRDGGRDGKFHGTAARFRAPMTRSVAILCFRPNKPLRQTNPALIVLTS
jgi:hypothetical protein